MSCFVIQFICIIVILLLVLLILISTPPSHSHHLNKCRKNEGTPSQLPLPLPLPPRERTLNIMATSTSHYKIADGRSRKIGLLTSNSGIIFNLFERVVGNYYQYDVEDKHGFIIPIKFKWGYSLNEPLVDKDLVHEIPGYEGHEPFKVQIATRISYV